MFVSRGLVGPKCYHKLTNTKGKQVNIPVPCANILTHLVMLSGVVAPFNLIISWSTVMVRIERKSYDVSKQTPGAREKVAQRPYREPTQVPLVEKTQACRNYLW